MADERLDRPPISSSRLSAADVARHTFATVRRGFEPHEVRAYLDQIARELQQWEQRDEQLREQVAAAEETAKHPVLDEATLTAALGKQSALVLRNAHDEAARIMGRAEADAQTLMHDTQEQSRDLRLEAESSSAGRIAEAELAASTVEQQARVQADDLVTQAQAQAEALVAGATREAEDLVERAREQGRGVLLKVQEARREVLADLAQRRRALHVQIEQFRAARDELAATVLGVRDSVDTIVADLVQADERARMAASSAGAVATEAPAEDDEDPEVELDADPVPVAEASEAILVSIVTEDAVPRSADTVEVSAPDAEAAPDPDAPASSIDELFARIRANQPSPAAPSAGSATDALAHAPEVAPAAVAVADRGEDDPAPAVGSPAAAVSDEATSLIEQRGVVLDPIVVALARRLKRSLQDDQNRLLDRLRSDAKGGATDLPLPGERQRQAYVEAATPQLEEAFAAGATFARGLSGSTKTTVIDSAPVGALADELAAEMVATLRRRLGSAEDSGEDPIERVRAAYREWRGERIERLVGDVSLGAFSEGVLAGAGAGSVRWLVAGTEGGCADCDDNSLADPVLAGSEFPTGHRHPPVHAGCRCLVAPAPDA